MYTTFQRILDMYPDKDILKNELINESYSTLRLKWKCGSVVIKELAKHFNVQQDSESIRKKVDQKRVENGSARRLHIKYRWMESLNYQEILTKVKITNITEVSKELKVPRHIVESYLKHNGYVSDGTFHRVEEQWAKGKTKETDIRIANLAEKLSNTMKEKARQGLINPPFHNKTEEQIKQSINKALQTKLERFDGKYGPPNWSKGLTKNDHPSIARGAEKTSKTRKAKIASGEIDIWKSIKACHFEGTKIENAVEEVLKVNNLSFTKQELLFNKFLVDFVDQVNKIVIFADGCYFHACDAHRPQELKNWKKRKQIDASQTAYLTKCGYKVFRFWEHEIKADVSKCVQQVVDYINNPKVV
jgi:very-short-patch-repair endonuclease